MFRRTPYMVVGACIESRTVTLVTTKFVRWEDTVFRKSFTFLFAGKLRILLSLLWVSSVALQRSWATRR